jgi:hypothetical protein
VGELVSVAWASASTFRGRQARRRQRRPPGLAPQKDWAVNQPAGQVLPALAAVQRASGKASLADLIVLAGVVGVEQAARGRRGGGAVHARRAGHARRTDRRRLVRGWSRWPTASATTAAAARRPTEALLIDKAQQLTLTAPELTVLIGGLRVLGANPTAATTACSPSGRRAQQRLLREPAGHGHGLEGRRRLRRGSKGATGPPARCAGRPRARPGVRLQRGAAGLAEVYASADARPGSCATSSPPGPRS